MQATQEDEAILKDVALGQGFVGRVLDSDFFEAHGPDPAALSLRHTESFIKKYPRRNA
jgi:hypothetical protein